MRYYLERRDPEFEAKMAEVLSVYQEVAILRAAELKATQVAPEAAAAAQRTAPNIAFVSYDEKPGIQANDRFSDRSPRTGTTGVHPLRR